MVDVFDEVEEQLRSDRYKSLALKSAPWLGGLAAAAILGVGGWMGWTTYETNQINKASEAYQAALDIETKSGPDKAFSAFEAVSKTGTPTYKALSLMQMGGVRLHAGKTTEAVAYFDQAAKLAPNRVLADAAGLNSALALLDTAPYKDVEARLTPLMGEKSPYRVQAKEALAFAKLLHGDMKGARDDFSVLTLLGDSSDEVRERAQAAVTMIDAGSAKELASVVKAAVALPPMSLPSFPSAGPQPAPEANTAQ